MFRSARLKLTAWYLLIIMAISLSFSAFIYRGVTLEFQRRLNAIEKRLELHKHGYRLPVGRTQFFIQDLEDAKKRVLLILLYTNGAIFAFSAMAGYFLAGKTLTPIEKAMEEQKRFIADASHELKTPLTALRTSIEVALRDKKLRLKEAKDVLSGSLDDIDSLRKLATDLLSLTSYSQGYNFRKEKVNVKEIIKNVNKKIAPLARTKNIKIISKLKNITFTANRENLEKLITILLDNAVKYTEKEGRVNLSCEKGRRYLTLKVKDTGIGISKKDLPHIFDRFYRVDPSRSKVKVAGFGLGLSIAKKIVELNQGSIDVKSSPSKGSTFIIKLPLSHS